MGKHRWTIPEDTLSLVRELARLMPDRQIARLLNRAGKPTGRGQRLDPSAGALVRATTTLPSIDPTSSVLTSAVVQALRRVPPYGGFVSGEQMRQSRPQLIAISEPYWPR